MVSHILPSFVRESLFEVSPQVCDRKAGVIFDFGRQRQLAQRQRPLLPVFFGDRPLDDQGMQGGPCRVYSGSPTRRPRSYDDDMFSHEYLLKALTKSCILSYAE